MNRLSELAEHRNGAHRGLALLAGVITACASAVSSALAHSGVAPDRPADEVRLGYFANVTHAQAVLGVDSGDFAQAVGPAKLTTRIFNAGPSLVEALFAGEIDIGYVGPSPALNAHLQSRGKGIRVIAGAAANGVVIVARAGSGIEKLEDLKGKRVATPQLGNTQDVSARHYLLKVLGQANADNVIPVPNSEQASMMSRGEIDAAWAVEPWGSRLVADAGAKAIGEEKDLWPDKMFVLTLIVVSPEYLAKHADVVEKILAAHCAWTSRLVADPLKHAVELESALEKLTGKKLSSKTITDSLARVKFTNDPLPESMKTFAQWAYDLGHAKGVPNVSTLVDTSLLSRVQAKLEPPQKAPAPPK